ncbi:MAG: hypothetical protein U1E70_04580 [Acetobacteraceae bacterium]
MTRNLLLAALIVAAPGSALADPAADAAQCHRDAGTFLAGTVIRGPRYAPGHEKRRGVYLSHTRLTLRGDDGKSYDVAIDNVFANQYRRNQTSVPAPLNTIRVGDKLELCGQPFPNGIHWVHTNCGVTPSAEKPNGWVRKVGTDGSAGDNMEAGTTYCRLWAQ